MGITENAHLYVESLVILANDLKRVPSKRSKIKFCCYTVIAGIIKLYHYVESLQW